MFDTGAVKQIVADVLGLDKEEINETTSRGSVEEWDSFNHLLLISELETKLNIKFTMDEVENIKSYKELEDIVEKRVIK